MTNSLPPDLEDEILSLNAIFDPETLCQIHDYTHGTPRDGEPEALVALTLPRPMPPVRLLLGFSHDYPLQRPAILRTYAIPADVTKGYGSHVLQIARDSLEAIWQHGEVCLFELVGAIRDKLDAEVSKAPSPEDESREEHQTQADRQRLQVPATVRWTVSQKVVEMKSTFVAQACVVISSGEAANAIQDMRADKRLQKATHNIWAYRARSQKVEITEEGFVGRHPLPETIVYQDCDDDGESAAGGRLLALMQAMDVWNVLVVVSRWYGGVKMGPERFRVINNVARELLADGGWAKSRHVS